MFVWSENFLIEISFQEGAKGEMAHSSLINELFGREKVLFSFQSKNESIINP